MFAYSLVSRLFAPGVAMLVGLRVYRYIQSGGHRSVAKEMAVQRWNVGGLSGLIPRKIDFTLHQPKWPSAALSVEMRQTLRFRWTGIG